MPDPVPGTAGPLTEYALAAPLRDAGWTPLPPLGGQLRWRSPDGARCWPTWRALEWLREQEEQKESV